MMSATVYVTNGSIGHVRIPNGYYHWKTKNYLFKKLLYDAKDTFHHHFHLFHRPIIWAELNTPFF